MTDLLPLFWPLVDAAEPVFPGRIVASWAAGAHEQLVELGILQPAGNAEYVLCPECFEHEEEIIALPGPGERVRFMIPCPEALRVEVPPVLLQQWAINLSTLTARLAAALHLPDKPKELVPQRLWRLGRVNLAGNLHDLLFARRIGANDADFQSTFATALRPIVLFAGDVPSPQWWLGRRQPSASIPLVATCTAAGIVMGQAVLLGLVSQSEETNSTEALAFRRRGEFWVLNFGGETAYLKDSVGLAYIARLLSEPHRDIPAVSLLAARAGIDPRISTGSTGDALDNTARTNYSARYQDLCEDLEDATRNHDEGRIVKLQEEMEKLSTELACATGLGGRGRKKSDAERVRIAVSMAVRRAIEAISEHHAPLGRHLFLSISSGQVFRYSPDTRQEWVL
jgi:hypothetical protein